ncbi:MAG: dihydroorotase [Methanomassiliicoccales archaeon]|jgi:dihydroorotase|nr:dihydroorotase [Methanomassiliicoccales archaeon]
MEIVVEGRAFYQGTLVDCCIGIEGGKIVSIKKILKGEKHYNYSNKLILPAAIDAHVHFRDPGLTHKEDFQTGTIAAAFGGVSCIFDMPNTLPPAISVEAIREKTQLVAKKAWVDFGLFGGCAPSFKPESIADMVIGYKLFMSSTTGMLLVPDDQSLTKILASVSKTGKVISVHAEDEKMILKLPEKNLFDHDRNRPIEAEINAIRKLVWNFSGRRIHICHISAAASLNSIENSKFTTEVTPHHLLLDNSFELGAFGKVNPPLRNRNERELLFEAFANGKIDIIASDHAPHTIEEKEDDFDIAPCGMPGVETTVPLMLNLVRRGLIDLKTLIMCACEKPAQIFGLPKGRIEVGFDGDLVVVDLKKIEKIRAENLHSKCGWTAFENYEAIFPHSLFLRGMLVVEDRSIVGERVGRNVVVHREKPQR